MTTMDTTTKQATTKGSGGFLHDMDRFRSAFTELKAIGYFARMNQFDGWAALPEDVIQRMGKYVFWPSTATPQVFDEHGDLRSTLYLKHFARDAKELQRVLVQYGLNAVIQTGRGGQTVAVLPQGTDVPRVVDETLRGKLFNLGLCRDDGEAFEVLVRAEYVDAETGSVRLVATQLPDFWLSVSARLLDQLRSEGTLHDEEEG
jgi:hypothetical protein